METDRPEENSPIRIRKARLDDLGVLKKVVARAFDRDPFVNWMVIQDEKRTKRIELFCETGTKHYALQYEHVFTTEDCSGVTIWFPPEPRDCWNTSTLKDLSIIHKWISIMGIRKMPSRLHGYGVMKKHHLKNVKEPHYYLNVMCVDPAHQSKGIGSALVQHGLRMCNEKEVPAYLEAGTEKNLRFYQGHGFKMIEEFLLPANGPKTWPMIYEPQ